MSKKKPEHVLFDQINQPKSTVCFGRINTGKIYNPRPQNVRSSFVPHRTVSHGR